MGFWGLEVESGMTSGESKKRKGRTRKPISSWSKTKFPRQLIELESFWLEFYVNVDKFPRQLQHDVEIEFIVLDL